MCIMFVYFYFTSAGLFQNVRVFVRYLLIEYNRRRLYRGGGGGVLGAPLLR